MTIENTALVDGPDDDDQGLSIMKAVAVVASNWKLLTVGSLSTGLIALGIAFAIPPTFTASTSFLTPQQQQSAASSILSSLGALSGLAGGSVPMNTPADQYVALMKSATVSDHIVEHFKLLDVYGLKYNVDARRALSGNVRFTIGKKDGLISIEVDDKDPKRAADIANRYVEELRLMTGTLAMTEAQQRRKFFESQLQQTQQKLVQAQQALEASGFTQGALKAEPKAAADSYARLKAEITSAEVRLQTMRGTLSETAPEMVQQQRALTALKGELAQLERTSSSSAGPDYVGKYREFKYQETLFDVFARQYELARADESREGSLIQVIDKATPPERKSKPKRGFVAATTTLVTALVLALGLVLRQAWKDSSSRPAMKKEAVD
jgi:uncharacterized protein involved in exopolysaccharide biosynthesis